MLVYGGVIKKNEKGRMVFDTRGFHARFDIWGDEMVRPYDDHYVKQPGKMLFAHPDKFLKFVFQPDAPRHRGSARQIAENITRLGLTDAYGPHPWGVEIKKPEIFTRGFVLHDVLHAKEIGAPVLQDIDPIQALKEATIYIREVHEKYGPVGDLVGDIVFQRKEGSRVVDPILNIPDVILTPSPGRIKKIRQSAARDLFCRQYGTDSIKSYEKSQQSQIDWYRGLSSAGRVEVDQKVKKLIETEQKATDVLEHMIYTGFEMARIIRNPEIVRQALATVIEAYGDKDILKIVKRFFDRGRPTMPGKGLLRQIFMQHNTKHMGTDRDNAQDVRKIAIEELEKYLKKE